MAKHAIIEVHLEIADSILNPKALVENAAKKVQDLLLLNYDKKESKREVNVLITSYRLSDKADTDE